LPFQISDVIATEEQAVKQSNIIVQV
jgi:hypothetical protein